MLSYITSYLASRDRQQAAILPPSANDQLRSETRQWAVDWEELQIERPIGRGSFGWVSAGWVQWASASRYHALSDQPQSCSALQVYLAKWHETQVCGGVWVGG